MFCSFEAKPLILRLYGAARTIHDGEPGWDELLALFPPMRGSRNIFDVDVDVVQTSCGFGVPFMDFVEDRETMDMWSQKKGAGVVDYQQANNRFSIDGLPTGLSGLPTAV